MQRPKQAISTVFSRPSPKCTSIHDMISMIYIYDIKKHCKFITINASLPYKIMTQSCWRSRKDDIVQSSILQNTIREQIQTSAVILRHWMKYYLTWITFLLPNLSMQSYLRHHNQLSVNKSCNWLSDWYCVTSLKQTPGKQTNKTSLTLVKILTTVKRRTSNAGWPQTWICHLAD